MNLRRIELAGRLKLPSIHYTHFSEYIAFVFAVCWGTLKLQLLFWRQVLELLWITLEFFSCHSTHVFVSFYGHSSGATFLSIWFHQVKSPSQHKELKWNLSNWLLDRSKWCGLKFSCISGSWNSFRHFSHTLSS